MTIKKNIESKNILCDKVWKVCLILLFNSLLSVSQNLPVPIDTTSRNFKSGLHFGLTVGCGFTTFKGGVKAENPLVRPGFQALIQQTLSPKSTLQYKAMFRSFGFKRRSGSFNGVGYRAYSQFDFAGLSFTYLRALEAQNHCFLGVGLSSEYLLKDRIVTILEDGTRFSNASIQTYRSINAGGQIMGQYRHGLSKKLRALVELEYNFGLVNFVKPIAYQISGDTAFSNGLFLNIGILF